MFLPPDTRSLDPETQNYIRQRAIHLRQQGESFESISFFLGVHRDTVSRWWQDYQQRGELALRQQQRGRKAGDGSWLTPAQCEEIQQMLQANYPEAFGIESALWTRRALQALIQQKYGLKIPVRTLSDYLHRWGFSPQKPQYRSYKQDAAAVEAWLEEDYPAIERQAQRENAEIHWGDEAGLKVNDHRGRGFAPVGETPTVDLSPVRGQVNYIATISAQGTVRFKLYTGRFNATVFIAFLDRLIAQASRKILLIIDNHPVHWATAVQLWFDAHEAQIEVFYLPTYSPELNPAEYLNCDVKEGVHSQPPTRSKEELQQRLSRYLHQLQKLPQRIISYFQAETIAYAAP